MRPRWLTPRNFILFLLAGTIFTGLSLWISRGMPLPGSAVPSTEGKLAFVSDRAGSPDLWMMNGDGSGPVALTSGPTREDQPSWSPNGSELAFIGAKSERDSPQVFLADATPGRNAVVITRTSGAKSRPRFGDEHEVLFLDAGKLTEYDLNGQDSHAVFPESDFKRVLNDFLAGGGLDAAYRLAEHRYLLVLNTETGQALLLYEFNHDDPNSLGLAALGSGEKIKVALLGDGGFVAAFEKGVPLKEPVLILNAQIAQQIAAQGVTLPPPNLPTRGEGSALALFDATGKAQSLLPLPAPVSSVVTTPDGKSIIAAPKADPQNPAIRGLLLLLPEEGKAAPLTDLPASDPVISPDGKQVAFVSGKDIYVVPTQGGDAKNLTQGKGHNSAPAWSPTLASGKK